MNKRVPRFLSGIQRGMVLERWSAALRATLRGPALHTETQHNIWHLYLELPWSGVLSAAAAFNAAFAVRLGASNTLIGWLSSVPSLLAVVLLIPAARFLETKAHRTPWVWGSLFVARLGYGLVALLPWLIAVHQAEAMVWLLIAISVPSTFFSAGFNPLLADIIPERDRARVFANRNIIASAGIALLTLAAGRWLEGAAQTRWAAFPVNYQILYIVGFLGSMVSMAYLLRIKVPASKVVRGQPRPRTGKPSLAQLKFMFRENRDFVRIIANTLVFDLGAWLVGPLYIILFVRELGASDGWIGLNSTLANVGVVVGYALWRRWIRRLGYSRTLLISIPLGASYAFLVALFPNLTLILVWGILINLINPGINLSHFNILLKLCPDERRASYIAIYATVMNAGAFVGPMIGVTLAGLWDVRTVLLIGGGVRLAGALLFHIFRIAVAEAEIS